MVINLMFQVGVTGKAHGKQSFFYFQFFFSAQTSSSNNSFLPSFQIWSVLRLADNE